MIEITKALQEKIDKLYSEMSGKMSDLAEGEGPRSVDVPEPYYPSLFVAGAHNEKKPGDKCYLLAIGEVERIEKRGINVKVKKLLVLPADAYEEDKK